MLRDLMLQGIYSGGFLLKITHHMSTITQSENNGRQIVGM